MTFPAPGQKKCPNALACRAERALLISSGMNAKPRRCSCGGFALPLRTTTLTVGGLPAGIARVFRCDTCTRELELPSVGVMTLYTAAATTLSGVLLGLALGHSGTDVRPVSLFVATAMLLTSALVGSATAARFKHLREHPPVRG